MIGATSGSTTGATLCSDPSVTCTIGTATGLVATGGIRAVTTGSVVTGGDGATASSVTGVIGATSGSTTGAILCSDPSVTCTTGAAVGSVTGRVGFWATDSSVIDSVTGTVGDTMGSVKFLLTDSICWSGLLIDISEALPVSVVNSSPSPGYCGNSCNDVGSSAPTYLSFSPLDSVF